MRLYDRERKAKNPELRAKALEYTRRYAEKYPERRAASATAWRAKNQEKVAAQQKRRYERFRLKQYALTTEQHAALLARQSGVCAICHSPDNRQLSVDHVHDTGAVRGLLCRRCNLGLGCFGDNAALLEVAISYLQRTVENPTE